MNSKTLILAGICSGLCILSSCTELKRPEPNPYLAESRPPSVRELKWSNGPPPKSLDPAKAAAAPETDLVRAVYEGLTVIDPKTDEALPAVAESWSVSDDRLTWTFRLRSNAKWSNGKAVTSVHFVRSWNRLNGMGDRAAHDNLMANFARKGRDARNAGRNFTKEPEPLSGSSLEEVPTSEQPRELDNTIIDPDQSASIDKEGKAETKSEELDVEAPDDSTLVVKLRRPDKEFPRVVAHPIFSPVFDAAKMTASSRDLKVVGNGALKVASEEGSEIVLERSETYWNRDAFALDKVTFISITKPDEALAAYREGKVDLVTNTEFAPLAQKLFSPYADFKKSAFAALNFYDVNHKKAPFNDRRVREALSISLEREKISDIELEGTTLPAFSFLPFASGPKPKIVQDKERAVELLEQAGFPGGSGFPVVRLVINRNDVQHRVARAAARMWKSSLNIDTDIIIAENTELEAIRKANNFDLIRRGVVYPTSSEAASMDAFFGKAAVSEAPSSKDSTPGALPIPPTSNFSGVTNGVEPEASLSEAEALFELQAIPIYFPMSFSLVKPYVNGYEINSLDSVVLVNISINSEWRPLPGSSN